MHSMALEKKFLCRNNISQKSSDDSNYYVYIQVADRYIYLARYGGWHEEKARSDIERIETCWQ